LSLPAPFPCKEVFQILGSFVESMPTLEQLTVTFVFGREWKNWINPLSSDFEFEELPEDESFFDMPRQLFRL